MLYYSFIVKLSKKTLNHNDHDNKICSEKRKRKYVVANLNSCFFQILSLSE